LLLDRLRIRGKLSLLAGIPLVAMVLLAGPVVAGRLEQAARAASTARAVRVASQVGLLVQDIQQERLLAVGYLVNAVERTRLVLQFSAVTDEAVDVRADLGDDLPAEVADALKGVQALADVRTAVLTRASSTDQVVAGCHTVIDNLLASLRLIDVVDSATGEGRQVVALDALLRANEADNLAGTYLVLLAVDRSEAPVAAFNAQQALVAAETARFVPLATPAQIALQQMVSDAFTIRFGPAVLRAPAQTAGAIPMSRLFLSIESFAALDRVAEQRMADRGHVHAHLMRAPGFEPALDQRRVAELAQLAPMRHRAPTAGDDRDLLAVDRRPRERRVDRALQQPRHARDDRLVPPIDRMRLELACQPFMRAIGLGGDHQPRRVLVDPMHDPRSRHAADAGELAGAMVEQCVDQSAVEIAGSGVHDQSGLLVDHDQMLVLEHHLERNVLRLVVRRFRRRHCDAEQCARRRLARGIARQALRTRHLAGRNQRLEPFTRQRRDGFRERTIQPPAVRAVRNPCLNDGNPPVH